MSMTNQKESDCTRASLLSRAKRQDSRAWNELVQLYGPLIAYWCRKCGLDHQQSSDGVQEVFAAVVRSLDNFQPQRESGAFRAWLWTITCNKVRDMHRRNHGQPQAEGGSSAMGNLNRISSSPNIPDSEPTEDLQLTQLVARALQQVQAEFEDKTWRIFQRTVVDQLPTHLVAEQFQVTAATVRQVRSRVLRRLRQQLGDVEP
jgi:RNA polymerase sigma-70 factor (ECF subfamily)